MIFWEMQYKLLLFNNLKTEINDVIVINDVFEKNY